MTPSVPVIASTSLTFKVGTDRLPTRLSASLVRCAHRKGLVLENVPAKRRGSGSP